MIPWLEALGALMLAATGLWLGWWFSRRRGRIWALGYFIPLVLVAVYGAATRLPQLALVPPISWMMLGRAKFAIIGFIAAMVLATPLFRLPQKRDRIAVLLLVTVIALGMSVWPFLAAALNRGFQASLQTKLDEDGVCLQSTDYNCGPAAAVTALRRLGFPAEEGQIAILAHTSNAIGTPPDILAAVLLKAYGKDGLVAEYRTFRDVADLSKAGFTLAVIKYSFWLDHYVVVLEVGEELVQVADPLSGLRRMTRQEFEQEWRFVGVALSRK